MNDREILCNESSEEEGAGEKKPKVTHTGRTQDSGEHEQQFHH